MKRKQLSPEEMKRAYLLSGKITLLMSIFVAISFVVITEYYFRSNLSGILSDYILIVEVLAVVFVLSIGFVDYFWMKHKSR